MLSLLVFAILVESSIQVTPDAEGCSAGGCEAIQVSNASCAPSANLLQVARSSETIPSLKLNLDAASPTHKAKGNILYVIRTWHKNYDTKLPSILETWASTVDGSSLLIVGDQDLQNSTVHAATGCLNDHNVGLTCKTGHSLALAAEMIGTYSWAFVIDDDVYVNTSNLEGELKKHDASKLVALGRPGCGAPHCDDHQGGLCGGGGYALSRAALKALVDKPTAKDFQNELLDMTKVFYPGETPWDDVTTACLVKRRGITIENLEGLYGWRVPGGSTPAPDGKLSSSYIGAIHSVNPLPLTFHYISPEEMYTIQSQFMKPEPEKVSLLQELSIVPSYGEQVRHYIHQVTLRRRGAA